MTTKPYLRFESNEQDALDIARAKNRACKRAGNLRDLYVVTDGPENNSAIMDLESAIDLGLGYRWET